jgi:hypothetical protein
MRCASDVPISLSCTEHSLLRKVAPKWVPCQGSKARSPLGLYCSQGKTVAKSKSITARLEQPLYKCSAKTDVGDRVPDHG